MRAVQRIGKKKRSKTGSLPKGSGARTVVVRPAGYPLKGFFHEYPEMSEFDVFEFYAREQWSGYIVRKGDYLFDRRMFPDFAFKVVEVDPEGSVIGRSTNFIVEDPVREMFVPEIKSSVTFSDIIGQEKAKKKCKLVERFLEDPEKFGKWAPRNILFHGPSGTGKTMMAKALANETEVPLVPVKATQLIGEFVGDGARQMHQLYDRAEELEPCIIFIDELDAIALDRRFQELRGDVAEIVNALLTEMDGIEERKGVCTIAATNRIESLDPAVRSRFEEEIEFSLPDEEERFAILKAYIKTFPLKVSRDVNLKALARLTKGFSGRDLVEKVLKAALHEAILEGGSVCHVHLEGAYKRAVDKNQPPKGMFA